MIDPGECGGMQNRQGFFEAKREVATPFVHSLQRFFFFFFVKKKALHRLPFWSLPSFLIDYLPLR